MPLLEVQDVTKKFGGLFALRDLNMHVESGEILGVIGPNGAGKSTLFNAISGFDPPEIGKIVFLNKDVTRVPPDRRCHLGIGRTFQLTRVFSNMSVFQNVLLGYLYGKHNRKVGETANARCYTILDDVGLRDYANRPAKVLTFGQKKRLEVARAISSDPKLLLLDEVMVGLNPMEMEDIMDLMRSFVKNGMTIVMIEHVMKAVMKVSDRIVVLANGQKLAEGKPKEVVSDERVVQVYLGEKYA